MPFSVIFLCCQEVLPSLLFFPGPSLDPRVCQLTVLGSIKYKQIPEDILLISTHQMPSLGVGIRLTVYHQGNLLHQSGYSPPARHCKVKHSNIFWFDG